MSSSEGLLRWIYVARLTLAAGIFAAALLVWTQPRVAPEATLVATLMLVLSLAVTAGSFWHTHIAQRPATANFRYAQALFDLLLVTAVVHMTGRAESDFVPLYVLVITEAALLLPARGGILIGVLAILVYFADALWGSAVARMVGGVVAEPGLSASVFIQMGLFAVIALATVLLGDRLRRTGSQLGEVESELRQLRLDTSDILGTLDTGVVTVDPDGGLIYMNSAAEHILGMESGEWLGRRGLEEMDRVAPGLLSVINRTLRTGRSVARYETHSRAGDELRVLGVRTTALERDARPWVTVVLQDITNAQRVEALHRRAERLEAVAELSASLAHEIKNPLASIRSAVEQLVEPKHPLERRDRSVLGGLVLAESDRLSRLLSGFIEFSRVEIGSRERMDLLAVAREAAELVDQHPDAGDRSSIDVSGSAVQVEGDPDLVHRAIFNLVLNAVQHSPDEAPVRVEVDRVSGSSVPPGAHFSAGGRVRVSDAGPGIAEADHARVFDPFFTTRPGGSGLGLALVHRAVQAHDGLVFIDGNGRGGTTFTVFFPERLPQGAK
jgi:two-component system sensor histidine kinase PilS (NtrC family)